MSAPNLSSQERQTIENKYRQTRQTHESEKQRLQAQLNDQITNARQYFADARQSLNAEEQQMRTTSAQNKITIQQLHDAEVVTLDKQGRGKTGKPSVPPSVKVRERPCAPGSAELVANAALSLLNLACYLLDKQIASQERAFVAEGGFTERLYRVRSQHRK